MAGYWPNSFFACLWTKTMTESRPPGKPSYQGTKPLLFCFSDSSQEAWEVGPQREN